LKASSGKITRYRLNRGGDRQGNRALYLLAVGRMGWDPATKAYVERRTAEGRTKPEIIRCLLYTTSTRRVGRIKGYAGLEDGVDSAEQLAADGHKRMHFILAFSRAPVQVGAILAGIADS
jgi:hypothetical protein